MTGEVAPTDVELVELAGTMLSSLGEHLREPSALAESVRRHRHLWVMLFELGCEELDERQYGTAS